MSNRKNIPTPLVMIWGIVLFVCIGIEYYIIVSAFDIYKIVNIGLLDFFFLAVLFALQYLALKQLSKQLPSIWQHLRTVPKSWFVFFSCMALTAIVHGLLSTLPLWIFLATALFLFGVTLLISLRIDIPFHKTVFLLIFGAILNSSLFFLTHETLNADKHIRYAKKLAAPSDTTAIYALKKLARLQPPATTPNALHAYWEKQWFQNAYLASNYRLRLEYPLAEVHSGAYEKPILTKDIQGVPQYSLFFKEGYALHFKLNKYFRQSIYTPNTPYKQLDGLRGFLFTVVDQSRVRLSNTHAFDKHLSQITLPEVGTHTKVELTGYDVTVYCASNDVFVLIGEPLSEFQVWTANFGFFFSLFLCIGFLLEIIRVLFARKFLFDVESSLPLPFRIQMIMATLTCLFFIIIALFTFLFLRENNRKIFEEQQLHTSDVLRYDIMEKLPQYDGQMTVFPSHLLMNFADKHLTDIAFFDKKGTFIKNAFVSATNFSETPVDNKVINQLKQNNSLILLQEKHTPTTKQAYIETYFGIFDNHHLQGIVRTSAFYAPKVSASSIFSIIAKLLSVYVFLLLMVWAGGIGLIRMLTEPLQLLATKIRAFQLGGQNEKLSWKGKDAIGQVISEYNKMVDEIAFMTKKLLQAEREQAWQVMAQQIAHEVNNRLTPLRLNIQFLAHILQQKDSVSDKVLKITKQLEKEINALSGTANQFKLFAKLDVPQVQALSIKPFIQDFYQNYDKKAPYTYQLKDHIENDQPIVQIDAQHFQIVLNTLLQNAEQAMPGYPNNLISIHLQLQHHQVVLKIIDNRKGIEQQVLDALFDLQFSTTSRSGLGLPICKRIIELYNGTIQYTSTKGGETTCTITFPCYLAQNES